MNTWREWIVGATLLLAPTSALAQDAGVREVEVVVEQAYAPSRIEAAPGERLRLRFVRRGYGGCTREVVFPTLGLRRELPTGEPVVVDLPPLPVGETPFQCSMNMVRGVVVVRAPPAPQAVVAPPAPRRRP
ncbi:MAG: hypothetical protein JWM10_4240, partial [Myxococcaceae bacterium]|nr:hypothetical protein [Myxococcaceae bacterium]